jgi:spore coat protein U-like protein
MIKKVLLMVCSLSFLSYGNITDNLGARVHVKPFCRIKSYRHIQWPLLNGTFPSNIDNTSGSITTTCTRNIFYTIGINNGDNYNAKTGMRNLSDNKGHFVQYEVYSDSLFSRPWKEVGTPYAQPKIGTGLDQISTLYARIPKEQSSVPAGNYHDHLIVSLHF